MVALMYIYKDIKTTQNKIKFKNRVHGQILMTPRVPIRHLSLSYPAWCNVSWNKKGTPAGASACTGVPPEYLQSHHAYMVTVTPTCKTHEVIASRGLLKYDLGTDVQLRLKK